MKQFFTLLTLISISIQYVGAQNAQIKGQVNDETGEAVSFATVALMNVADTSMVKADATDLEGGFILLGVPAGEYFLQVTYVGYEMFATNKIEFDGATDFTFDQINLRTQAEDLQEVVVKSTRPIVEVQPDKTVFNVEGSINASGNTALELLRKSPGVVVDNNDNIILAGKNGVQVFIDGKLSPLSADDLANYLKTMQSDEIDAIEIITQPSAKYDAEGNAGIINIRLRKDKSLGANGSVTAGYRYGLNPKYNTSGTFNYRNKTMNVFGNYGYFNGEFENDFWLYREQGGNIFDQTNTSFNNNESHNFKLGTDFFLDKKSTIGFLVSGNISNQEDQLRSNTLISDMENNPESILRASNDMEGDRDNLNFNINYVFTDNEKGQTVNVDLDYGRFRNDGISFQPNEYFTPDETRMISSRTFRNVTPTDIDIYTAKIDHERNAFGGKLGMGVKTSLVKTDNTFDFFDVIDNVDVLNPDRSNNFVYEENINAAYASFQRQINEKWNLMLGLRMEHTNSKGDLTSVSQSGNNVVDRNYVDIFPSGGLTYQLNPKNSFRINYSRRIDRPSYQDLNPFEFKLDELSFQKGNPFLNPQYSNSYSLTHTFNYRLNTTLSYTRTNDVFTQITDALDESTTVLTYVNLAKQTNLSLTVSYPFQVKQWWSVYANTTAYRVQNQANFDGKVIDLAANVFTFYGQNTFLLPKGFKFELSGWYNSPGLWEGNWTTNSMYSIDAGIQKKLFQDKATLKLSLSDIFLTQQWGGESTFGDLFIRGGGRWESRQVRLNFTYLFGNSQVKGARNRKTGLEDEKNRVKSDN